MLSCESDNQVIGVEPVTRFGVIVDGMSLAAWQACVLDELIKLDRVELAIVMVISPTDPTHPSFGQRISKTVYSIYERSTVIRRTAALRSIDMTDRFSRTTKIQCSNVQQEYRSNCFKQADLKAVRDHQLDFVIHFGSGIIRGDILEVARWGAWAYMHGDKYRGGPPCLWEIQNNDPVTGVTLVRLANDLDGGIVLRRGFFATVHKSYVRNLNDALFGSTDFPASVVRNIRSGCAEYLDAGSSRTTSQTVKSPTNLQATRLLFKMATRRVVDACRWLLRHEQWVVGVIDMPIHMLLDETQSVHAKWMTPLHRDQFIADSFGIRRNGGTTLIAEQYDQHTERGWISAIDWPDGGEPSTPQAVIEGPYHMSYPYLLEHEGQIYCVPETAEAKRIDLYRAIDFPMRWERVTTLINGFAGIDPTVFRHDGRWWLLCAEQTMHRAHKLHAFYCDELTGSWTPHPGNPLKTDVRSTRPAGTPFVHNDVLYRPAQDCSHTYGERITINRVDCLTTTGFSEATVRVIEADRTGPVGAGCHTIAAAGDCTIIDGKRWIFIPVCFRRQLFSMLRFGPRTSKSELAVGPRG